MTQELMKLIHENCNHIKKIRNLDGRIQVQIPCVYPDSETSWIELSQAPVNVEKAVRKWIELGGEI
jgi:hypothetical protein